jgi:hypothetical protein
MRLSREVICSGTFKRFADAAGGRMALLSVVAAILDAYRTQTDNVSVRTQDVSI